MKILLSLIIYYSSFSIVYAFMPNTDVAGFYNNYKNNNIQDTLKINSLRIKNGG